MIQQIISKTVIVLISASLLITVGCKKEKSNANSNIFGADYDGNIYKTIQIGNQVWMAENLRTTHYSNGDAISSTSPSTLNISSKPYPHFEWSYGGNDSNVTYYGYGKLYTWYSVTDSRNVCPTGFHVPDTTEWNTLITYLGGDSIAGGKMKTAADTVHWLNPNTGATNSSGFSALPGGYRDYFGTFYDKYYHAHFWSSTLIDSSNVWTRTLGDSVKTVIRSSNSKYNGLSVRCVRD